MLIFFTLLMLFTMSYSISPLKMSLFLTFLSILISKMIYIMNNSVFIPCGVIISFSSGMMILFSYCSMMTNHENKSNMSMITPFLTMFLLIILSVLILPNSLNPSLEKMSLIPWKTNLMISLMMVIIISMMCMNMTFFNPTKKFLNSY